MGGRCAAESRSQQRQQRRNCQGRGDPSARQTGQEREGGYETTRQGGARCTDGPVKTISTPSISSTEMAVQVEFLVINKSSSATKKTVRQVALAPHVQAFALALCLARPLFRLSR
mmetsp:Transcript_21833/g.68390  ORF Transcript_21833/g.68390 Transcript_21833/m.68390 type:complete len:115 (-) Transcript_21833:227-571(-)